MTSTLIALYMHNVHRASDAGREPTPDSDVERLRSENEQLKVRLYIVYDWTEYIQPNIRMNCHVVTVIVR